MGKYNRRFCVLFGTIVMLGCSRNIYDIDYKGESNYSNFYLVDTIKVVDPVRIHSPKFGGQFIISKSILKEYNNKAEFFTRPDVFILGDDLYRDLPPNKISNYHYPDNGGCEFVPSNLTNADSEVYELKGSSQTFLLGMINANYYYVKHNSNTSFQYPDKGMKKLYYKIVYPICK